MAEGTPQEETLTVLKPLLEEEEEGEEEEEEEEKEGENPRYVAADWIEINLAPEMQ